VERRIFLRGALLAGAGAVALGGSLWKDVAAQPAAPAEVGLGPYGLLAGPDDLGVQLPPGFAARVVARSGEEVAGSSYTWHPAPDGGACFADSDGGWVYASNSEMEDSEGGVGVLRFDRDGDVTDAYPILSGSTRNCSGGATTWGTWLSCEESARGVVWETYPLGGREAVQRPAMGRFRHEAAAVDPDRRVVYLTEDHPEGCFYRFVPERWPDLSAGRLEVLVASWDAAVPVTWQAVPDPAGRRLAVRKQVRGVRTFDGGEGCVYAGGIVWFTAKGDNRVWRLDVERNLLDLAYDQSLIGATPLRGVDNIARTGAGDLFIAEDRGNLEICVITAERVVSPFLRLLGHRKSEITGPAFSPDGRRLYFSSQRGTTGREQDGVTYEITGPFRGAVAS
jgi:secreted PhoX family phosphatase